MKTMRRLALILPVVLLAVGCGAPPAGKPSKSGERGIPYDGNYGHRRCVHYYYVYDENGVRHRTSCPHRRRPTPTPVPDPNPMPTPAPPVPPYRPASGCGVERWSIKTLTDPGAKAVSLTPKDTTIAGLVAFAPPVAPTDRVAPVETTAWRIHAHLDAFKQEADSDIHLAVHDDAGDTMIVEFPSPSCDQGSTVASQIAAARDAFVAKFGQPTGSYQSITGDATITGIGFFDRIHGQRGVAPNGIELHPVVAITFP